MITDRNDTIFGKIIRGEIPCDKVYEDDKVLAFRDIAPQAPVHVLVIPKKHIEDLRFLKEEDGEIMSHMMLKIAEIAHSLELHTTGYRVIQNNGQDSGQEVPHLHFHILGGAPLGPLNHKIK